MGCSYEEEAERSCKIQILHIQLIKFNAEYLFSILDDKERVFLLHTWLWQVRCIIFWKVFNLSAYHPLVLKSMIVHVGNHPQLLLTMAGLTMAGKPTNPPPRQYKLPILTKAQPHGNLQQNDIQTKIANPPCGTSTAGYAVFYRPISTNKRKPTMTLTTSISHPTLQKNIVKYETKMVFNNSTIQPITSKQVPTDPCSAKALPVINQQLATTQTIIPTNKLPSGPDNGCHTIKISNKTRSNSKHPNHLFLSPLSPPRNPKSTTSKYQPPILTRRSSLHPSKLHNHCSSGYSSTLPNPVQHSKSFPPPIN